MSTKTQKTPERVLSGIRATGRLHIGNFLGAVNQFVEFDDGRNECFYFIADFHTLTTSDNPDELRGNLIEIAKDYIAAGLNPETSSIFAQSNVSAIPEIMLILSMRQSYLEVLQMPTIKDLFGKVETKTMGILSYPILMTADILGIQATLVPVGSDQIPNVELARVIARKFNNRYRKDLFTIPEMLENMIKIPGLDGEKMGKSDSDNSVDINATIPEIRRLYMKKGITDAGRTTLEKPGNPTQKCKSVYPVHEAVTPGEISERIIAKKCLAAEIGCAECKGIMVDNLATLLEPFQEKRAQLANQDDYIMDILKDGAQKANVLYSATLEQLREVVGLERF